MNFASDNVVGGHPRILEAMLAANEGTARSYGQDDWSRAAENRLSDVFERDVKAFLLVTGTAANALILSALATPYGAILCQEEAHVIIDEGGAVELFTGGAKLLGAAGERGKLTPQALAGTLKSLVRGERDPRPAAVSITQASELGRVYTPAEIGALSEWARGRGMRTHMDGARFANAVASLGCSPADITWKAGVDAISFGATKNGAVMVEAAVFFDHDLAADFASRRMRGGHLLSKGRFLGAQMLAYLADDLWLANARHANAMARRLAEGLGDIGGIGLPLPTEANEVFPLLSGETNERLKAAGAVYHEWPGAMGDAAARQGKVLARLVCSFLTTSEDVERFVAAARAAA